MKNIVIIGGGTGTSTLLEGLKKYQVDLSVIVSTADDGGSSGVLRKELGVLPPGDVRQCLVALASNKKMAQIFAHRLATGEQKGHAIGNLILATLEKELKSPEKAIALAANFLGVKGAVIPVTLKPTLLSAILENGEVIHGEHLIDQPKTKTQISNIKSLQLKPRGPANPRALTAIKTADVIVFGPGDLFTSTVPNLLVKGIKEAVNKSTAKKVLISNIMTKHGQTGGFKASDFVRELQKYLGGSISAVIVNNKKPWNKILNLYKKEKAEYVEPDAKNIGVKVIAGNFVSNNIFKQNKADKLKRSILRHGPKKLAKLIFQLL